MDKKRSRGIFDAPKGRAVKDDQSRSNLTQLLEYLSQPSFYPHPVDHIEIVETHISIVVLTGRYVYKIKKPINLGFANFSTLKKRKYFCEQEVTLNQRLAPDIYLGVVVITARGIHTSIDDSDLPIEYAVKMRQFDRTKQFDSLLAENRLTYTQIQQLAQIVAKFHVDATVVPTPSVNAVQSIHDEIDANFEQCAHYCHDETQQQLIASLRKWATRFRENKTELLSKRWQTHRIRDCHGDLHLGNIVVIDDVVTPFDCIEFNSRLREIDVISELAFTLMDLDVHGSESLGTHLLNVYLQQTGDYEGAGLLPYYLVYRAVVRAKVLAIGSAGKNEAAEELKRVINRYLQLAHRYATKSSVPLIIITHGLSGCGKSFLTDRLLRDARAIRIRSDVERKRLAQTAESAMASGKINSNLYTQSATDNTYAYLLQCADEIITAGFDVILDATYLDKSKRQQVLELARSNAYGFVILDLHAPVDILRKRITQRSTTGNDVSDATLNVLEQQLSKPHTLNDDELEFAIHIDTSLAWQVTDLVIELNKRRKCLL